MSLPPIARGVCLLLALARLATAQSANLAFPVGERAFPAELAGIDREWHFSFEASGKVRVVSVGDLAYWGRYRESESGGQLVLVDGSVVRADLLRLGERELVLGDASGLDRGLWSESTLPRTALAGILYQPPAATQARDRLLRRVQEHAEADDLVFLMSGEDVRGTVRAVPAAGRLAMPGEAPDSEQVTLSRPGGGAPLEIPLSKIMAVALGGRIQPKTERPFRSARLGFADGTLVHARSIGIKGNIANVALAAGGILQSAVPAGIGRAGEFWKSIRYVEPLSPRVQWLSDAEPLGYKHIPFLSVSRPHGVNTNVLDMRLRSQEAVIPRGIGMPSASRLAYDVAGFRRFEGEIAIDDAAELAGSVVFKVLLEHSPDEWKPAYESPVVRGGEAPRAVSVELSGAARMALIVDFADRGDACDYANWLHARLTK